MNEILHITKILETEVTNMNKKAKQIAAWICIIILVILYLATFIIAMLDFPGSGALFQACLVATIGLPILLWIYIWLFGKIKDKHTIASLDILQSEDDENTDAANNDSNL